MGASATTTRDLNKVYEVPEGKTSDEYKALAQKYANKCKEMVSSANRELNGINAFNFKTRAANLRKIANKEPFEQAGILVGGSEYDLMKKNEQICTLVVVIIVLITAFILLGCYILMHGGAATGRTDRAATDNAYRS